MIIYRLNGIRKHLMMRLRFTWFKIVRCLKNLGQYRQPYGFSFVCIRKCCVRWLCWRNLQKQFELNQPIDNTEKKEKKTVTTVINSPFTTLGARIWSTFDMYATVLQKSCLLFEFFLTNRTADVERHVAWQEALLAWFQILHRTCSDTIVLE